MKNVDQVESMTVEASRSADAQAVLESLPIQDAETQLLKELIAKDKAELENSTTRLLLRSLTWAMFIVALGVMALLIRAVAKGYLK